MIFTSFTLLGFFSVYKRIRSNDKIDEKNNETRIDENNFFIIFLEKLGGKKGSMKSEQREERPNEKDGGNY